MVAVESLDYPALSLTLLGGFHLRVGETTVPLAAGPQRLVAFLALKDRAVRRGYVAGLLWGDTTETRAHGSLRSALWKLRSATSLVVESSGDSLKLCPEVDVDVRRSTSLGSALIGGRFDEEAVALLDGRFSHDLLPSWDDEWLTFERERQRQLNLHALEALCEHLTQSGRYGAAVLAALAAIDLEPLRESAHRALMRVYIAEGNAGEVLKRYRQYEEMAARDLGVEPSAMMRSLLHQIAV